MGKDLWERCDIVIIIINKPDLTLWCARTLLKQTLHGCGFPEAPPPPPQGFKL